MKRFLPVLAILGLGALLLVRPDAASQAVQSGLTLCFRTVVPSLFPFFVVVSLLLQLGLADFLQPLCAPLMGPLFRMRGVCALPLLTGFLGGYPTGAKAAADLYTSGQISRQEAELLLGFCDNCGPAFLVGYVGSTVMGSPAAGARLFLIHIAAALLTGVLLTRLQPDRGPALLASSLPANVVTFPQALTTAASGAVSSTLNICAFVTLFRVLAALAPAGIPGAALGALEMVTGAASLSPDRLGFTLAAVIVGWGGLSVHCQALSTTTPAGLSFRWHWAGKAVQAGVAGALAWGVYGFSG